MKVLLYSGGMDSWLIDKLWKPDIKIYIDVQGAYNQHELEKLPPDVRIVEMPIGIYEHKDKYIPLRNLYFLMIASNYGDEICLGATAGDWNLKDKSPQFFDMCEDMLNFLLQDDNREIKIVREYLNMSKNDLLEEYLKNGGSIKTAYNESFSCYESTDGNPCMNCKPCFRKYVVFKSHGYEFSEQDDKKMFEYIRKEVVPMSKLGSHTYYTERTGEGKEAEKIVNELYEKFGGEISADKQN